MGSNNLIFIERNGMRGRMNLRDKEHGASFVLRLR